MPINSLESFRHGSWIQHKDSSSRTTPTQTHDQNDAQISFGESFSSALLSPNVGVGG